MTKFAFEVPLKHLDAFTDLQDYLFALSFLMKDPRYVDYLKFAHVHKLLILDNSFNELRRPQSADELWELSKKVNADYVISPDSDAWTTRELLDEYKAMKKVGFSREQILLPIRSTEEFALANAEGVKLFTIPYRYRPFFPESFPWMKTHFLGLRDPLEVKMCRPLSCDTSMPVKLATKGIELRTWILAICPHEHTLPSYFDTEMTMSQVELARRNIKQLKEMCE